MKTMVDKSLRLGMIGAVAALLLAVTNNFTEPVIAETQSGRAASGPFGIGRRRYSRCRANGSG